MAEEIILSICIPTYNRATYLDKCLRSIVKQAGNNKSVEIIISDNVSDDSTKELCESYCRDYSNVKYYRNETNIGGDKNFIRVLQLGNGKYLKLLNDYVEFKDECVLKLLEIVNTYSENKEILFFANGVSYLKKKDFYYSKDINEFLKICSFWSTWIGAFGMWKEDFEKVLATYKFKTSSFYQTELLFENFNLKKSAVTYSRQIFISNEVINKKTGYNFFDLFINSYLNVIIKGLKDERRITYKTYLREKNKVFSDFIFPWYKKIRIKRNHSIEIDDKGMESIIFNNYKYNPILYQYLLYMPFYMLGHYCKQIKRNNKSADS